MPSHSDEVDKVLPPDVTRKDVKGNKQADIQAGLVAKRVALSLDVSAPVLYYFSLVKRIQHRLATILVHMPDRNRDKEVKAPRPSPPSLDVLFPLTSHVLYHKDGRTGCARCHSCYKDTDPSLIYWLKCQCRVLHTHLDRPIPIPHDQIHMGNKDTHTSHKLYTLKGLVFCRKCGGGSVSRLHKLGHPCLPPTESGKLALAALLAGKLPPGVHKWPVQVHTLT